MIESILVVSFDEMGRIAYMNAVVSGKQGQTETDETAEKNQAHITIYTVIGDFGRVKIALVNQFADVTKEVKPLETGEPGVDRGKKVVGYVNGKKYRRVGIVAAQMGKNILAPLQ